MNNDDFYPDYHLEESPIIESDDLRFVAFAAGAVVVALALIGVGVTWFIGKVKPW